MPDDSSVIFTGYAITFLVISFLTCLQRRRIIRIQQNRGPVHLQWSSSLKWSAWGIFRWISMAYLAVTALFWFLYRPAQNYGHINLLILLMLTSLYSQIDTLFAQGGILIQMKLIQWDEVESWVFIKNKKRLLLLLKGGDTNLDVQITVPERYSRDVQNLMLRMLPDKQIKNG